MVTHLCLSREQQLEGIKNLETVLYWSNEYEMTGAAGYFLKSDNIDGIITLTAFGCGPDSLVIERIIRYAKYSKVPLLNLTIDEHTGEAGIVTRIEAFTDMLVRRKRIQSGFIPTHMRSSSTSNLEKELVQ